MMVLPYKQARKNPDVLKKEKALIAAILGQDFLQQRDSYDPSRTLAECFDVINGLPNEIIPLLEKIANPDRSGHEDVPAYLATVKNIQVRLLRYIETVAKNVSQGTDLLSRGDFQQNELALLKEALVQRIWELTVKTARLRAIAPTFSSEAAGNNATLDQNSACTPRQCFNALQMQMISRGYGPGTGWGLGRLMRAALLGVSAIGISAATAVRYTVGFVIPPVATAMEWLTNKYFYQVTRLLSDVRYGTPNVMDSISTLLNLLPPDIFAGNPETQYIHYPNLSARAWSMLEILKRATQSGKISPLEVRRLGAYLDDYKVVESARDFLESYVPPDRSDPKSFYMGPSPSSVQTPARSSITTYSNLPIPIESVERNTRNGGWNLGKNKY